MLRARADAFVLRILRKLLRPGERTLKKLRSAPLRPVGRLRSNKLKQGQIMLLVLRPPREHIPLRRPATGEQLRREAPHAHRRPPRPHWRLVHGGRALLRRRTVSEESAGASSTASSELRNSSISTSAGGRLSPRCTRAGHFETVPVPATAFRAATRG